MRTQVLIITVILTVVFPAAAQVPRAPKDGEAQAVSFDDNRATLKFSNKRDAPDCGLFISTTLTDNQEEAFAMKMAHMHQRALFGKFSFPEEGWLYITPTRIRFVVDKGDASHAFDLPRTALEKKPATRFRSYFVGLQINLIERLPASDSREQKFTAFLIKDKKCRVENQKPYSQLIERTVSDFDGAMAEFKELTASLKQAGKIQQAPAFVMPPAPSKRQN